MASNPDVRWKQRFENYTKEVGQLTRFIQKGELNELEEQGLIQSFEYTYELAWNTMKDFFEGEGDVGILGSRDAFRLAFRRGLIEDGETWMDMITSRTLTTHTYKEDIAAEIVRKIKSAYHGEFVRLQARLEILAKEHS